MSAEENCPLCGLDIRFPVFCRSAWDGVRDRGSPDEVAADIQQLKAVRRLYSAGRGAWLGTRYRRADGRARGHLDRRHPVVVLVAEGLQGDRGDGLLSEHDSQQALVTL